MLWHCCCYLCLCEHISLYSFVFGLHSGFTGFMLIVYFWGGETKNINPLYSRVFTRSSITWQLFYFVLDCIYYDIWIILIWLKLFELICLHILFMFVYWLVILYCKLLVQIVLVYFLLKGCLSSAFAVWLLQEGMVEFIGVLKIKVVKGTNLAVRDMLSSDPYVVLNLGHQVSCFGWTFWYLFLGAREILVSFCRYICFRLIGYLCLIFQVREY